MRPRVALLYVVIALASAGCIAPGERDEAQVRARLADIRAAILAREPEGIVRWGTPDWTFAAADGVALDRTAYLARARALFARVAVIESLETTVDRVALTGGHADVEITQHLVRQERADASAPLLRVRLVYREHQEWVRASDGWRVRSVRFVGAPERTVLAAAPQTAER